MDDYSADIKGFLESAQGKEMLRSLKEDVYNNLMTSAAKEKSADSAFGLIKEAAGVIKAIEHMMFLSVSVGERSKD